MQLDHRLEVRRRWAKLSFGVLISTIPACVVIAYFFSRDQVINLVSLSPIIVPALAGLVWIVHVYFQHCLEYDREKEARV